MREYIYEEPVYEIYRYGNVLDARCLFYDQWLHADHLRHYEMLQGIEPAYQDTDNVIPFPKEPKATSNWKRSAQCLTAF